MRAKLPSLIGKLPQRGFTLIEILVAFLILSVGLIGLAGLQLTGVKNTREAYHRTQATVLAADIMDRMRANLEQAEGAGYNGVVSGEVVTSCFASGGCNAADMAKNDIAEWRNAVANTLPAGDAIVCLDSSPFDGDSSAVDECSDSGDLSVVKIWWRDPNSAAGDGGVPPLQRLVTVFHP